MMETGISVGGRIYTPSDMQTYVRLVANSHGLRQLMDNLNEVTREFGMKINAKKVMCMCIIP